jgi:hypothetical protein
MIKVYPNPTESVLNIDFANNDFQNETLRVYNLVGHVVKSIKIDASRIAFDVSELPKGIYILNVKNERIRFTK